MSIEILKNGSLEKIAEWERKHDRRKTWRCERCGCEWKCEWKDNHFGSIQDYNGDPDILCPECGSNDTGELIEPLCENCHRFYETPKCGYAERPDQYADECHGYKPIDK